VIRLQLHQEGFSVPSTATFASRSVQLILALSALLLPGAVRAGTVELISRAAPGGQAQAVGQSGGALISADGNWIVFASNASDLLPGQIDGNNANDIFLKNRTTGTLTLVSHAAGSANRADNGTSFFPAAISADGRYVAFISDSTNLIAGQNTLVVPAFLWDRVTDTTVLISHAPGSGVNGITVQSITGMSDDGRFVAFTSQSTSLIAGGTDTNNQDDLFLWDRTTGGVTLVSHAAGSAVTAGNGETFQEGSLSGDGRFVVFSSRASDLIAGGTDTNGALDAFLWDRTTGTVTLVSHVDGDPLTAPATSSAFPVISRDGNWIAFAGPAHDLMPGGPSGTGPSNYFVRERATDTLTLITHAPGAPSTPAGGAAGLAMSADGSWVAFGDTSGSLVSGQVDTNNNTDVFLWERATNTNTLLSHSTAGPATAGNKVSSVSQIAADGSRVAFRSYATDLVAGVSDANGISDVFQWERSGGTITLISHAAASPGTAGNGQSVVRGMSADGNFVAYESTASDLSPSDTNNGADAFLWDRAQGTTTALSFSPAVVSSTPDQGVWLVQPHMLSADGRYAVYLSQSTHVISGQTDTNDGLDVFLVDRSTGTTTLVSHSLGSPTTGNCFFCNLPTISDDGGFIAYTDPVAGAFLYDRGTGTNLKLISGTAYDARISADGQFIAFFSNAALPGQTGPIASFIFNVYLYDRAAAMTTLISHTNGAPTQGSTGCVASFPAISADGRWVAYPCEATDLVAGQVDPGASRDIFLYDRTTGTNSLVSHSAGSPATAGNGESTLPWLSADGRWLAFTSAATDLLNGVTDTNNGYDAFLFDRVTGTTTLLSRQRPPPAAPMPWA
jgi:Tol biopolymer transport system component